MIQLPSQVAAYIDAANANDAERVAACFTTDGRVHDEGATRRGAAEIRAWVQETADRYQSVIEPDSIVETDGQHRLKATVRGNFPGSPAVLHFAFVLQPAGIASLEIAA